MQVDLAFRSIEMVPSISMGLDIVGLVVLLVSLTGLVGVAWGCKRLMNFYFLFVLAFVLSQLAYIGFNLMSGTICAESILEKSWDNAYERDWTLIRDLEREFKCQGFRDLNDRAASAPQASDPTPSPCHDILLDAFGERINRLGQIVLLVRLIQLFGVLVLSGLFRWLTHSNRQEGSEAVIIIGYHNDSIKEFKGDGINRSYLVDEKCQKRVTEAREPLLAAQDFYSNEEGENLV